ncbi:AbrB family transcriptional regulator, partial [Serratia oryzae]|uniref:AbrB family transcriptional regulator n=1 Tax=Serratia oryzae TaxID=2034155 RepID=UPI001F4FF05F
RPLASSAASALSFFSSIICLFPLSGRTYQKQAITQFKLQPLFGPLIVVIVLKRWRTSIRAIPGSITFIQLSLGISIGLMFRGMSFGETGSLFALLSLLCLCLLLQFITNYQWCIRRLGWSKDEAILGSVPGAMAAVLALATHINAPPQKIVISHAL